MKRRLLNFLTVLSLLLCAAAGVMWVRGRRPVVDYVAWRGDTTWLCESRGGRLWLERWHAATPVPIHPARRTPNWVLLGTVNAASGRPIEVGFHPQPASPGNGYGFVSFEFAPLTSAPPSGALRAVGVPWWAVAVSAALPPVLWTAGRMRRRRRLTTGRCPLCGYDLRATPGKCPECGFTPAGGHP